MKKIHEGLGILLKYGDGDIIYAGHDRATPEQMEKDDVKRLEALGWSYEDGEGWQHFT